MEVIERFLQQFCVRPEVLRAAIETTAHRWIAVKNPGEKICEQGEQADCCWIILQGEVDIYADDNFIVTRRSGELIGEQAFLMAMTSKKQGLRTARMIARGNVRLLHLNEAFIDQLEPEQRAEWFQTLAIVESRKLEEATKQRAVLQSMIVNNVNIIRRFADAESVGIIEESISSKERIAKRNAVIFFSDLAGFSKWAENKEEAEAAGVVKRLIGAQIETIRDAGGLIDKLMGDGLMAFWFIDSNVDQRDIPRKAILCAKKVIENVTRILHEEGLSRDLDIRVGLHKGPVAYGDFGASGRISVTLLGRSVNIAARYEQARSDDVRLGRLRFSPELGGMIEDIEKNLDIKPSGPYRLKVKNTEIDVITCEV